MDVRIKSRAENAYYLVKDYSIADRAIKQGEVQ